MSRVSRRIALALIRAYQTGISPALGPRCRFEPTCSLYAYQAIERFGVIRGVSLAGRRLVRCRPGSSGGFDPVPGGDPHGDASVDIEPTGSGSLHVA